ncbi:MAG: hypothetical protein P4L67_02115 [Candidatus Pacebacteria bacterium]|nr:hypothetical protein [Candidatus Paceibacterota bacterium]
MSADAASKSTMVRPTQSSLMVKKERRSNGSGQQRSLQEQSNAGVMNAKAVSSSVKRGTSLQWICRQEKADDVGVAEEEGVRAAV